MPNADTTAIRNKARRLKDLAVTRAIFVLENKDTKDKDGKFLIDKETYDTTYQTVLKNSVPRTQEITGEDGERIQVQITGMKIIKENGGDNISNEKPETA